MRSTRKLTTIIIFKVTTAICFSFFHTFLVNIVVELLLLFRSFVSVQCPSCTLESGGFFVVIFQAGFVNLMFNTF
jgi:hypothetical protein